MILAEQSEAVHNCYQWAWQVRQDPRAPAMLLYCATRVSQVVESFDQARDAYQGLSDELADWRQQLKRSDSAALRKAVESLTMLLGQV